MKTGLHRTFLDTARSVPDRPAVEIEGRALSYADLQAQALSIAATIAALRGPSDSPLVAILAERSASAFAGTLGALCAGRGFVPLLPGYPSRRIQTVLRRTRTDMVVVDEAGMHRLCEHPPAGPTLTIIAPTLDPKSEDRARLAPHRVVGRTELQPAADWTEPDTEPGDIAYVLFTSGSTGEPKGVMVSHANLERFLDVVVERYGLEEDDRFTHLFDPTFDLSMFDMFAPWRVGGCVCVPGPRERLLPARFVDDANITVWFSVPSTALLMKKTRTLQPGVFPDLRVSLFCGEALPLEVAQSWMEAAPNSVVENLYGPTELTLACTLYRCNPTMDTEARDGIVPIGHAFPGMQARVVDDDGHPVEPGEIGELALCGPQVALGYWDDPEQTDRVFVTLPGETKRFYRTGDRVVQPRDDDPLLFVGRVDAQIKVRGYRIDLGDVEAGMRRAGNLDVAVAVGWPPRPGGADGIVGFVEAGAAEPNELRARLSDHLPSYMIPREVRTVERFPLNANGKIDRNALRDSLD